MKSKRLNFSTIASGLLLPFVACNSNPPQEEVIEASRRPNIIFIIADDLGYGDIGCYGQQIIKTPNIDRMAAEGLRFTQHYAGTSVSAPSRCVLMTGVHTGHAVVRGNLQAEPYGQMPLPDSVVTVAELLKEAGYVTALYGKWGLGVENTPGDPQRQGFDEFYGYYCQVLAHNAFPEYLYHNGKKELLSNKVVYEPKDSWTKGLGSYATDKKEYSTTLFFEKAKQFVEANKDTIFFLYLPITTPHDNGEAPKGEKFESPTLEPYAHENWSDDKKRYAASITLLDKYVGELLNHLKTLGIDKNTLVVFTSDNGGEAPDMFNSNAPFRGKKRDLYEGGIRVPFIAWMPGRVKAGLVTDQVATFWDFLPTACELAGVFPPENIDGISYVATLLDRSRAQKQHEYLYFEFHEQGKKQAIRKRDWKAVRLNVSENPDGEIELYDLATDSIEANNVAAQHPDIVKKMNELMRIGRTVDTNWVLRK